MAALCLTFRESPEVWQDDNLRELVKTHFLFRGTQMLLRNNSDLAESASMLVNIIIVLENYDAKYGNDIVGVTCNEKDFMRNRDVTGGCLRSTVKFYATRIPCSCLDDKYLALKKHPKTGTCDNCDMRKKRSDLMLCSSCKKQQYCSQDCQAAHWPLHKEDCKSWSSK